MGILLQSAINDPGDLIPAGWTVDQLFGGIAGIVGHPVVLFVLTVGVAFTLGPRLIGLFRRVSKRV